MTSEETETEIKVVVVGQSDVGKTCIVSYLINGKFDNNTTPTLGAAFASKSIQVKNQNVMLQIWDTAGQERFRVFTPMYYRGAQAALVVYSIKDEDSFNEVDYWVRNIRENNGSTVSLYLVGNKSDLDYDRTVTEEQGREKADKINAEFFETSAVTGDGIEVLFDTVAKKYFENNQAYQKDNDLNKANQKSVDVNNTDEKKKSGCC